MPVYPSIVTQEAQRLLDHAIARWLTQHGLVNYDESGIGGDVFFGTPPKAPDRAIIITATGGIPDVASGTLPYDRPTVQILVRSERGDYDDGQRRAWQLYDALNGQHRLTLDAGGPDELYLVGMTVPVPPYHLQTDSSGRHLWTLNLQAMVKRPTPQRPTT